ncbi:hypothetical protein AK812_SmicGene12098 [Symbiodinium microadriaticum]|uniref:Uncharacterized protein n=1 Tax=Symbiodinium microadriaticum TaxID=2951 RepID=A0A1Q9EBK1_SYMMI|nr:hypothetical protein AK812_SmicGene12098 [Symbiodinium microadriaticum]
MAWAVACVYGTEHYALFEAAATKLLLHLGEEATYAWPLPWVMSPSEDAEAATPPPQEFTSFAPTDAEATLEAARALDAVVEETLLGWPAVLATFVRAHLVRRRESHPEEALSPDHVLEALHLAVAEGGPELATQAEAELERTEPVKAGESVATFSEPTQELLARTVSSDTALGPVPEKLSRAEAALCIYAHDLRHWAHDKDYRCLAAYLLEFFAPYRLVFLRVDQRGRVTVEEIRGADAPSLSAPRVPIGILAARPFARALRFLAVAVVCFESFVWPTAPAPAHVWVDFRGAWDLSAVALSTLARSASGAGCSVTVVGPATATAKTINTERVSFGAEFGIDGAEVSFGAPGSENEESESPVLLVASLVPHTLAPKELVRGMFRARAKALWVDSLTQEPLQGVAKLLQGGEQGNWEVAAAERWKTSSGGAAASGAQGKQGTGFLSATPARSYKPRWLRAHSEGGWRYKGLKLDSSMPCLCTLREGRSSSFGASKSWIVEGQDPRDDSLWLLLDGPEGTGARPIAVRTAGTPTRPPERA